MYTTLQHADLLRTLRWYFNELNTFAANRLQGQNGQVPTGIGHSHVRIGRSVHYCGWVPTAGRTTSKTKYITIADLLLWIQELLKHMYVQVAEDHVLVQLLGIPMGTNCAPFLASLYCSALEFRFLLQLIAPVTRNLPLLREFSHATRYIDDLFVLGSVDFDSYLDSSVVVNGIHGIYPPFMQLNQEQDEVLSCTNSVHFLDVEVLLHHFPSRDAFICRIWDKREHGALSRLRRGMYVHKLSFMSAMSIFGVVIAELFRYATRSHLLGDFLSRSRKMIRYCYLQKRYPFKKIKKLISCFVTRHWHHFAFSASPALTQRLLLRLLFVARQDRRRGITA